MEKNHARVSGRSSIKDWRWMEADPPAIEPFVPNTDHNPRELFSWAKRTGFNPNLSGESIASSFKEDGGLNVAPTGRGVELEPILEQRKAVAEIKPSNDLDLEKEMRTVRVYQKVGLKEEGRGVENESNGQHRKGRLEGINGTEHLNGDIRMSMDESRKGETKRDEVEIDILSNSPEPQVTPPSISGFMCDLLDNPGFGRLFLYGIQQHLSIAGSLIFIPLIMVPAMGGTDGETANVMSTVLLVSGITTIMHSFFGTRLPLVQGSSFVYLAPAMVIINSEEYRNLSDKKFKHIMIELQGAIIAGSIFQTILGYSGLFSLILRLINPVVVAPTIASIGLAFFSYGFPQAGSCALISIPLIILILIFALHLRRISIFGYRVFVVYAVPLSVAIVWAYAFFLTAGGAYNYTGCSSNIPSSNILSDTCRKHALTMKSCRTDVSVAWKSASWIRVPYPFQWGMPTFSFRTSFIMAFVSMVSSVDSIGSYHAASLLIGLRPPTARIVSRGIGLEGISGILAGLWGTGTASTTLTENIYTLDSTKMANRKALTFGAAFLVLLSFVGKVGALLASIPVALAAAVLCFTWALVVALGLSTMKCTQSSSSRNILIVGFTLFISLSVPSYFQQYSPSSSLILPSYLVAYAAASDGPINTGSKGFNYALNSLLSLNMVVALLVAFILDNTVPGRKQGKGAYIWSSSQNSDFELSSLEPYLLPAKVQRLFQWPKWAARS